MSYILPQVLVFQEFRQLPVNVVKYLNPFIFGPHYRLLRYSVPAEKRYIGLGAYDRDSSIEYAYPSKPANSDADTSYIKLFMDSAWGRYCQIIEDEANPIYLTDANRRNKLRAAPALGEGQESLVGGVKLDADGVRCQGYFIGRQQTPEAFYIYPYGGNADSVWDSDGFRTDLTGSANEHGKLKWVSTENSYGTIDIPGGSNPIGNDIELSDLGILLNLNSTGRTEASIVFDSVPTDGQTLKVDWTSGGAGSVTFTFKTSVSVDTDVLIDGANTLNNLVGAMYKAAYGASYNAGWRARFVEARVASDNETVELLFSAGITDITFVSTLTYSLTFSLVGLNCADGETLALTYPTGGITFTFKNTPVVETDVQIGIDITTTAQNLVSTVAAVAGDADFLAMLISSADNGSGVDLTVKANSPIAAVYTGSATFSISTPTTDETGATGSFDALSTIYTPRIIRFYNGAEDTYLELKLDSENYKSVIDKAISFDLPTMITIEKTTETSATWTAETNTLAVKYDPTDSLLALGTALEGLGPFTTSLVGDNTSNTISSVNDYGWGAGQIGVKDATVSNLNIIMPYNMMVDYLRITVMPNIHTFKTGNGYLRSDEFYSRDVQVGDRLRWQVDKGSTTYTCSTKIVGIEYDMTMPSMSAPSMDSSNTELTLATALPVDLLEPDADNQRKWNGAATYVHSINPEINQFIGDYTRGNLSDKYMIEVTSGGKAGYARATVTNINGTYRRTNVPIELYTPDTEDYTKAKIYLGNGLYVVFEKGDDVDDPTAVFKIGDKWTFSSYVDSDFIPISEDYISTSGLYEGPKDTTYIVSVTRGGTFERNVAALDGLSTPSKYVITYTSAPVSDITAGINLGNSTTITVKADAGGSDGWDLTTNLINAVEGLYAVNDSVNKTVTIYGPASIIGEGYGLSSAVTVATASRTIVQLVADVDWDNYSDVDDEYILSATRAGIMGGNILRFSSTSQRGDTTTNISFPTYGIGSTSIGRSVSARFDIVDWSTRVITCSSVTAADTMIIDGYEFEVEADGGNYKWTATNRDTGIAYIPSPAIPSFANTAANSRTFLVALINQMHNNPLINFDAKAENGAVSTELIVCSTNNIIATISETGSSVSLGTILETSVVDPTIQAGNYWIVKIFGSRPQVTIVDTASVDSKFVVNVEAGVSIPLGLYGVYMTFANNPNENGGYTSSGGLIKGDKFYINCVSSKPGPYKILALSDDVPSGITAGVAADGSISAEPDRFSLWFYMFKDGVNIPSEIDGSLTPDYNWEADEDGVTINPDIFFTDLTLYDGTGALVHMPVYQADMYLEYRALLHEYSDSIYSITDPSDVMDTLGELHPDNPLALGVYKALENSGDKVVYFMATPTNDLAGYSDVLEKATLNEDVYAFAPITQDIEVHQLLEAHINNMSTETEKSWRIGFVSHSLPDKVGVYTSSNHPDAPSDWLAVVEADVHGDYKKVRFVGDSPTQCIDEVVPGDELRIVYDSGVYGDETYESYIVDEVESNTVFYITDSTGRPINAGGLDLGVRAEVWHTYTMNEVAEKIGDYSTGYSNRRMYNVFPSYANNAGVTMGGQFVACAVAGLACAVPPQQGITNIEINGFDDLPLCYKFFSKQQLNKMAENGTLIVMQNVTGGRVYVRHQVSTAAIEGNLNTTELSITKNLDSISYYFAAKLAPFIGRYNITPEIIQVIRTSIDSGINYLQSFTNVGILGPQLLKERDDVVTKIRTLQEHPELKDRLYCIVDLVLPYPLNVIELHLVV